MADAHVYVYGIVTADHPCDLAGVDGVGGSGCAPRRLAVEETAAIVGAAPAPLFAWRRDLLAHRHVLDRLWQQGPVLPMRFGVVSRSEDELRSSLAGDSSHHVKALAEVADHIEINIRVTPDEVVLIGVAGEEDPRVRALRPLAHSYLDRLRLGEALATAVTTRARADAGLVRRTLDPLAVRHADAPMADGCAMDTNFLVAQGELEEFLDCVADLRDRLTPRCEVRATSPRPPYSFTERAR